MLPLIQKANDANFLLMQTQWKAQLDPVIGNPLVDGILLRNISLVNGTTMVNHLLGRKPLGWFIVDQDTGAMIYRSSPLTVTTLTLTSNAGTIVSLWVF